jgi:hypothetical protein
MDRGALLASSGDGLVALILAQAAQAGGLAARMADLKARLAAPPKAPDISSPPSKPLA